MKLKSLILQGFKSFSERTVINFHEGVTAIVGPNGSGKSNITDAIRWVLGEQTTKNLRVNKMDELIFSGTENKRALSYAEVSLIMDNSDMELAIDFAEVKITRRLYRSGESEYLINDKKCRLKDITELFLDTGIGKDGYSMIGQGRVDDILSGNSELRRKMLDEASGISKYKLRKLESSRKLELTEQNLIRINDILNEVEKQKGPLESQAKKANKYLLLREELKSLDLAYLFFLIENQEIINSDLEKELEENSKNIELADAEKSGVLQESAKHRETIQINKNKIASLEINLSELQKIINTAQKDIALYKQEISSIDYQTDQGKKDQADNKKRLENLNLELKEKDKEIENLDSESQIKKTILNKTITALNELELKVKNSTTERLKINSELKAIQAKLEISRQNIQKDKTEQELIKQHRLILEREQDNLNAELKELDSIIASKNEDIEALKVELGKLSNEKEASARDYQNLLIKSSELETLHINLEKKINELRYQIKTQRDLQESYEGYGYSVRNLMNHIKDSDPAVHGPLASLLNVPSQYELAISNALGGMTQNIVVDTEVDAKKMINLLKSRNWGRATFLPINQVRDSVLSDDVLNRLMHEAGFIGLASELIDFDPNITSVVDYALGKTVVVDTLDNAVNMAKSSEFRTRIVSLDGDIMNPGGSMSGGSNNKDRNAGLVSRKRLIEDLLKNLDSSESSLRMKLKELSTLKAEEIGVKKLEEECKAKYNAVNKKLLSHNLELNQLEKNFAKLDSQVAQNSVDLKNLSEKHSKQIEDINVKALEEESLNKSFNSIQSKLEELDTLLSKESEKQHQLLLNRSEESIAYNKTAEQMNSLNNLRQRLLSEKESLENAIAKQKQDKDDNAERKLKLKNKIDFANNSLLEQQKSEAELLNQVQELNKEIDFANEGINTSSEALNNIATYLSKLGQNQGRLEQKLENNKQELMNQRSRLWEEYNLTFAARDDWYKENLDVNEAKKDIDKLKKQIKNLGQVNVQAIEQSKEVNERYEFTKKQKEDIELAAKDLRDLIQYLTKQMEEQFAASFDFIGEQFNLVFQELFSGGSAKLTLADAGDLLNSEINISASPPGKKVQNILSLSGGERCLTAIALLFAIQKLNPAPFCVLDEVEAALDEANIFRFSEYIQKHSKETQYSLVTHRRGTMESANTIYGVTMPERGISKVISLNLDDNVSNESFTSD